MTLTQQLRQAYHALPTTSALRQAGLRAKRAVRDFNTWRERDKCVKNGVNIIGFARGDFGLGEHIRLVTKALQTTSIHFCVNEVTDPGGHTQTNQEISRFITPDNPYKINLLCFNASDVIAFDHSTRGGIARTKHYNIGYGYWELSRFPSAWTEQNNLVDELWAPSRFIQHVLEKASPKPVQYMPLPVDFAHPVGFTRARFRLPTDRYLFLFSFDWSSHLARKNPQAVVEAFTRAFPPDRQDKVGLVIKVSRPPSSDGSTRNAPWLDRLVNDSRIQLIDQTLDRTSMLGLISVCDAYLSLHRSEGFGLGMAEAMKMGKVVIATNYSGNQDFMTAENSCPVNYDLVKVKPAEYTCVEEGAEWAEPDLDHAVHLIRKVVDDPAWSGGLGRAAARYMKDHHNVQVIGERYHQRLAALLR